MNPLIALHLHSAKSALTRIIHQPFASLLSLATLALALLLPLLLYLGIVSTQDIALRLTATPQMTVFTAPEATDKNVAQIHQQLKKHPLIKRYSFIGKNEALAALENKENMAGLSDTLPSNPLPDAFVITPVTTNPTSLSLLQKHLSHLQGIQEVTFDLRWAKRLYELISLGKWTSGLFSVVFGFVLVLITYNIIYMQILNRKEEITVSKLIGASDSFIRRLFFYHAFWQSCLAAIMAWVGTQWLAAIINPVVQHFADLYHEKAALRSTSLFEWLIFMILAVFLALMGAKLAVDQHLRKLKS